MSLGAIKRTTAALHEAATLAALYLIPASQRKWGMTVRVYNDGTNNGEYTLVYNESSTTITDNNNWVRLKREIEIGAWNMDTTSPIGVNHGLGTRWQKIRSISVVIIRDDGNERSELLRSGHGDLAINSTQILLGRTAAATFDSVNYTSVLINRGFIYIEMIP